MKKNPSLPWTHFKVVGHNNCRGFELGICENCGSQVELPNAIGLMEPPSKLLALGLIEWSGPRLPEIYYSETNASEMCCDNCM